MHEQTQNNCKNNDKFLSYTWFLQINLDTLITQQRDTVHKQMLKDLFYQKITQATLVSETMTQLTLKYIYMNTIHSSITLAFYLPNTLYP